MTKVFYFGLENVTNRYTQQLSEFWMPSAFIQFKNDNVHLPVGDFEFISVLGDETHEREISTGAVLDYVRRSTYSFQQISKFLQLLDSGEVQNNDIVYLQDFWTPGVEAIPYAASQLGINLRFYSMLHAQSVDEYDFTYKMKDWMRDFELGLDKLHSGGGIFVGSTIHKNLLREAGFESPIHVVSLPIDRNDVLENVDYIIPWEDKKDRVVFTSRLDAEKQPMLMLSVAEEFVRTHPEAQFVIATSNAKIRSSVEGVYEKIMKLVDTYPNFRILTGLSKTEYYELLNYSKIQLNTSLQDFVSWTLLEADIFGCGLVYPDFRSFPECLNLESLYRPHKDPITHRDNILGMINYVFDHPPKLSGVVSSISDVYGRQMIPRIIFQGDYLKHEYNIWNIFGNAH